MDAAIFSRRSAGGEPAVDDARASPTPSVPTPPPTGIMHTISRREHHGFLDAGMVLRTSRSTPALFTRIVRRKLRLLPSDCLCASLGYLSVRDVCAAACVDSTLARCVREDALWADIAARMDVTIQPPARTFKTAVRLALSEPLQWIRGEYVAAQRLARAAGFPRNFFASTEMLGDRLVCGSTSGAIRTFRVHEVNASPRDSAGRAAARALPQGPSGITLQPDFSIAAAHTGPVMAVAWINEHCFASAGADRRVLVWNADDARAAPRELPGAHAMPITCLRILRSAPEPPSPAASTPVEVSATEEMETASAPMPGDAALPPQLAADAPSSPTRAAPSPSKWMFTADEAGVGVLWDILAERAVHTWPTHSDSVSAAAWASPITTEPGILLLATGGFDGAVSLWIFDEAEQKPKVVDGGAAPQSLERAAIPFAPTHVPLRGLPRSAYRVYDVAFSSDSRMVAAGCGDGCVRAWDVRSPGVPLFVANASPLWIKAVAFGAGTRVLFAAGGDHRVRVFNVSEARDQCVTHSQDTAERGIHPDSPSQAAEAHTRAASAVSTASSPDNKPTRPHGSEVTGVAIKSLSSTTISALTQRLTPRWKQIINGTPSSLVPSPSISSARPPLLRSIAAARAAMRAREAAAIAPQACRYEGTLDVHSGPVMAMLCTGPWLVTVSADESVVVRRFVPQWARYVDLDEELAEDDDENSVGTSGSLHTHPVDSDVSTVHTGTFSQPMSEDVGLDLDSGCAWEATLAAAGVYTCVASGSPNSQPTLKLVSPLQHSNEDAAGAHRPIVCSPSRIASSDVAIVCPPVPTRAPTSRRASPSAVAHHVVRASRSSLRSTGSPRAIVQTPALPMHPQLPFRLENPAVEVIWPSGRVVHVGQQPPATPRRGPRASAASPTSVAPGTLRMAGGPGATPILPLRMKRPGWQQGGSMVEHVSHLLALSPS